MARVGKARHVGYAADGKPLVVWLPEQSCPEPGLDFLSARHVGYYGTHSVVAHALTCCDQPAPEYWDEVEQEWVDCPFVEEDLIDGGAPVKWLGYVSNVASCSSAHEKRVIFRYCCLPDPSCPTMPTDCPEVLECAEVDEPDPPCTNACHLEPGEGKWVGSLTLRGGTIDFEICLIEDPLTPGDPLFKLVWSGCDETGCSEAILVKAECLSPLMVNFGQLTLSNCCDCLETTEAAEITLFVVANCRKVVSARHVDFTAAGVPVVAKDRDCDWDVDDPVGCDQVRCGLHVTITDVSGCACLEDDDVFPYVGDRTWENVSVGNCDNPGVLTMGCAVDEPEPGQVTLSILLVCGATNTGSAEVVLDLLADPDAMENLDVTFDVDMEDPSAVACEGDCTYEWNDMSQVWQFLGDTCDPPDNCDPCPNGPDDNSPGSVDGEQRSQPCVSNTPSSCCVGSIQIRVRRHPL